MHRSASTNGFTIVEILIALTLLVVLAAVTLVPLRTFRNTAALDAAARGILTALDQARTATLSSREDSVYGVHLQADKVVFFKGATYATTSSSNIETILDSSVYISTTTLAGGGSNVVFNRLTGTTGTYGTTTIVSRSNASLTRTIVIKDSGVSALHQ